MNVARLSDERIISNRIQAEDMVMRFVLGEMTPLKGVTPVETNNKESQYLGVGIGACVVILVLIVLMGYFLYKRQSKVRSL